MNCLKCNYPTLSRYDFCYDCLYHKGVSMTFSDVKKKFCLEKHVLDEYDSTKIPIYSQRYRTIIVGFRYLIGEILQILDEYIECFETKTKNKILKNIKIYKNLKKERDREIANMDSIFANFKIIIKKIEHINFDKLFHYKYFKIIKSIIKSHDYDVSKSIYFITQFLEEEEEKLIRKAIIDNIINKFIKKSYRRIAQRHSSYEYYIDYGIDDDDDLEEYCQDIIHDTKEIINGRYPN